MDLEITQKFQKTGRRLMLSQYSARTNMTTLVNTLQQTELQTGEEVRGEQNNRIWDSTDKE